MSTSKYPALSDMEASAAVLREALSLAQAAACAPGATTKEVDRVVHRFIRKCGARPAFLGYDGFPASICISVNQQVVHCIPSTLELKVGDLVSIDCGVEYGGAITDACRSFFIGRPRPKAKRLVDAAYQSLKDGVAAAAPGNHIGDISFAIQAAAERSGFNVSREFVGHSVGRVLHQPPWIPNYGRAGTGAIIKPGMFLAIEPILFDGSWETEHVGEWNVVSKSGCLSAHVEDTVYISQDGPVVLT